MTGMLSRIAVIALAFQLLTPLGVGNAQAQETGETSVDDTARELLALNLYFEARSEGREGMIAVGWVVLNRIADEEYPDTVETVINQRRGSNCEWGWTCDGRSDTPTEEDMWQLAQEVSEELLSSTPPADPTDNALWFHETSRAQPGWMRTQVRRTVTRGGHHFYARS